MKNILETWVQGNDNMMERIIEMQPEESQVTYGRGKNTDLAQTTEKSFQAAIQVNMH